MYRIALILTAALITVITLPGTLLAEQDNGSNAMTGGNQEIAIFAGGCFWCVESDFDKVPGVTQTVSGYIGGDKKNPTYKVVSRGGTGHTEAVEITYDPKQVSYQQLLEVFWRSIDPTTANSQFCDHGDQYRSGIFYRNGEQQKLASDSKAALEKTKPFKEPIVTEITAATKFYPAEEYHQNYYKKNPLRYKYYRFNCGRDRVLEKLWGKRK
jgi:peptide-methionine (S)-S-oxide reductase